MLLHMNRIFLRLICAAACLAAVSCARQGRVPSMEENGLFSLGYGNFEEQLNLFSMNKVGGFKTELAMRDGFFYIVNGEAEKILSLNSYGDLLSLFYNEDFYGSGKKSLPSQSSVGKWKKIAYPFALGGAIAADARKYIYTACAIPKERNEQNASGDLLYSQVVLRISSDGSTIDYIGQQGPAGTPFPYISKLYTTENNELVVICKMNDGLCAYWFAENGFLRYKVPVSIKNVPLIASDQGVSDIFVTVENIVPDNYALRLYVKADYYLPSVDAESNVQSGVHYTKSLVYPLNVADGAFGEPLTVPPYEESVTENFSRMQYRLPYNFLGITKNGWLCFIVTTESGFSIEMISDVTRNVVKRHLDIKHQDVLYYTLAFSNDGIISALLADKNEARVVWWRADLLIASLIK